MDAWNYVGFFLHYDNPDYLPGAYKLARLPWILSGWVVHRVTPADLAPYLLHAGFLVAATAGFCVLVLRLFDSAALAALGAMLLGFSPQFHGSGGWDYHNTAAGAFYIWALAAATIAAQRRSGTGLFIAGALAALALHSNITLVNLVPLLAIHYGVLRGAHGGAGPRPIRHAIQAVALSGAGAATITAALMGVNLLVGRDPMFFFPLLEIVTRYTADPSYQAGWWQPWSSGWVRGAVHLALPGAVLVCALPVLWTRISRVRRLVLAEFVGASLVWIVWQSVGQTALNFDYFAYPLLPHAFLALVALAPAEASQLPILAVRVAPVLLALPLALRSDLSFLDTLIARVGLVSGAACAVLLCALLAWHLPTRAAAAAFLTIYSLGNALAAPDAAAYEWRSGCDRRRATHFAVLEADRAISVADPNFTQSSRLWFPEGEVVDARPGCAVSTSEIGYALAGLGLSYFAAPFPMPSAAAMPDMAFDQVVRSNHVAWIVTGRHETRQTMTERIASAGLQERPIAAHRVQVGDAALRLEGVKLEPRGEAAVPLITWDSRTLPVLGSTVRSTRFDLPYVSLTDRSVTRVEVSITPGTKANVNCAAVIEDQSGRVLEDMPCGRGRLGRWEEFVPVDATTRGLRVSFRSVTTEPLVLPREVKLTERRSTLALVREP